MNQMIEFTATNGQRVAIPLCVITGITESHNYNAGCFIATGADSVEYGENGWYVKEGYEAVKNKLDQYYQENF